MTGVLEGMDADDNATSIEIVANAIHAFSRSDRSHLIQAALVAG